MWSSSEGGLVFKALRLSYHSFLSSRLIKKKQKFWGTFQFVGFGNVFAGSQSAMWSTNIGSTSTCFDVLDLGLALAREPGGGGEA